jgi:putative ABC transport system permease protein
MLKHFLFTAFRNLRRNKLFTTINVLGLSIASGVFLALASYVQYHFSFDKFYEASDRIYRIDYYEYQEGQPVLQTSRTHDRTAFVVHDYVPEIEAVARAYNEKAYVWTEDVKLVDQDMLFADSSFLKVFKLNILSGSEKSLEAPLSVMISQSQAKVYFGSENPMGKTLFFNERLPFVVTGVFEDIPAQSSIDFDFLLSWSTMPYYGWITRDGEFTAPWTFTFVKLKTSDADIAAINKRLEALATDHITTLKNRGHTGKYALRPYEGLHMTSSLAGEIKPGINPTLLYALISVGAFILIAAWINYVNLSLARSLDRADEIGVRKVFGASRLVIGGQFLIEAFIVSVMTFGLGYILFALFTGPFRESVFGSTDLLPSNIPDLPWYFLGFVAITALVSFYPAHFISRFKPALILKNKFGGGKGQANLLHQTLMIFQLFVAVTILSVSIIAGSQISFIRTFDSGFNSDQTIALRAPASTNSDSLRYVRYSAFRNEVLRHSAFHSGTSTMNIPGQEIRFHDEGIHAVGSSNLKKQSFWVMWVDEGYQDTYGMELVGGRNFHLNESRGNKCMINETAARDLGYDNPADAVNTDILISGIIGSKLNRMTIIGVWKDYHHESVHKPVNPIVFYHFHPFEYGYYSFNVAAGQKTFLADLEGIWKKHYPNDQFIYYFMDRFFAEQYKSDELFGKLLNIFSVIAVTVAALGLFGIATLAMVKRSKEIGIRKVLGASVPGILMLLSKRYIQVILISCVFAFPLSYYLMTLWLQNFSYKITIAWWMIILPGVIVLIATLLTISIQSVRVAVANPVDSIRDQ